MLRVGLLAWGTSCRGLGCAVAADKREVPDVDHYVQQSMILLSRRSEYVITIKTMSQDRPVADHKSGAKLVQTEIDSKGVPYKNQPRTKHTVVEGMFPAGWLTF